MVHRSPSLRKPYWYSTLEPSGDHCGPQESCGSLGSVMGVGSLPSGWTTRISACPSADQLGAEAGSTAHHGDQLVESMPPLDEKTSLTSLPSRSATYRERPNPVSSAVANATCWPSGDQLAVEP